MPEINPDDVLDEEELEEYDNKYNYCYFESFYGACDHFDNPDEYPYHDKVSAIILNGRTLHMITSMIRNLISLYDLCMFYIMP